MKKMLCFFLIFFSLFIFSCEEEDNLTNIEFIHPFGFSIGVNGAETESFSAIVARDYFEKQYYRSYFTGDNDLTYFIRRISVNFEVESDDMELNKIQIQFYHLKNPEIKSEIIEVIPIYKTESISPEIEFQLTDETRQFMESALDKWQLAYHLTFATKSLKEDYVSMYVNGKVNLYLKEKPSE